MDKNRKNRTLAVAAICIAIVGVSVAYAALTASLSITGTATVKTENAWKIEWASISNVTKSSAVTITKQPTIEAGKQNISWAATFGAPVSTLTFEARLENNGTIPAKLERLEDYILATGDASNSFTYKVEYYDDCDAQGYVDIQNVYAFEMYGNLSVLKAGKYVNIRVTVTFDEHRLLSNEQLAALDKKTATFTLNLPFTQATDANLDAVSAASASELSSNCN